MLLTVDMSAQCNDCHFKYPIRTNLGGNLAMKHGVFEEVATETLLETIKKEPYDEANARNMRNYKNHVMVIHKQKAVACAGLNEIDNSELCTRVFKCQRCDKMFAVERHAKLHEVKNMDGNFSPKNCVKKMSQVILN